LASQLLVSKSRLPFRAFDVLVFDISLGAVPRPHPSTISNSQACVISRTEGLTEQRGAHRTRVTIMPPDFASNVPRQSGTAVAKSKPLTPFANMR
jgi:hypothetical protein